MLLALASVEDGKNGQACVGNTNGSRDIGHFQINTIHWKQNGRFAQYPSIGQQDVGWRGCYNAELAVWMLRQHINEPTGQDFWTRDTSLIVMVVILALVFDFINGFHDTANAIATCVSTRAIRPGVAIVGTAILNFLGAMISTGVAKTIGGDIVISPTLVNEMIIIATLVGAIIWRTSLTWWGSACLPVRPTPSSAA